MENKKDMDTFKDMNANYITETMEDKENMDDIDDLKIGIKMNDLVEMEDIQDMDDMEDMEETVVEEKLGLHGGHEGF